MAIFVGNLPQPIFWPKLFTFFLYAKYTYLLPRPFSICTGVHDFGTYILPHEAWLEACELNKQVTCLQHTQHTNGRHGQDEHDRLFHSEYSVKNNACSENLVNFMGQRTSSLLGKVIERMWSLVDPQATSGQLEALHPLPVLGMYLLPAFPTTGAIFKDTDKIVRWCWDPLEGLCTWLNLIHTAI